MPEKRYWFPARKFGWGWGLPITWQGWVALAIYAALLLADLKFVLPAFGEIAFGVVGFVLVSAFIVLCWTTGEPIS